MKFTPEVLRDPFSEYRMMRSEGRIHLSDDNTGRTWWVPGYADVISSIRELRLSSQMKADGFVNQFPPEVRPDFDGWSFYIRKWIVLLDPPEHPQLRKLMNKGFARRLLVGLRPKIQDIADTLLDQMAAQPEPDFMRDFAKPFPAQVIAQMLGVDPAHYDDFNRWSDAIIAFAGSLRPSLEMFRAAQDGLLAMVEYFEYLLPLRRANPGDDFISLLLMAEEGGDVLSTDDVLANCSQVLFAGHETTRNLVGNGLYQLLRHPDAAERLRREPDLMPLAVREMLRYDSPLQLIRRVVREDFEFLGADLRRGDGVLLMLGSANRDEREFDDPDEFRITRDPNPNIAFGIGPHFCIGAGLAELEASMTFHTILRRWPDLELADEDPSRVHNPMLRSLAALPLRIPTHVG